MIGSKDGLYNPKYGPLVHIPGTRMALVSRPIQIVGGETILPGMPTDGMSSPRFTWFSLPPFANKFLLQVLEHDHTCWVAKSLPPGEERDLKRLRADQRFRATCTHMGASWLKANKLYLAVRLGALKTKNDPVIPDYRTEPVALLKHLNLYEAVKEAGLLPLVIHRKFLLDI